MPDAHLGKGATVGSVIASKKAIIPAAVGVDIGCGMSAVKTTLTAKDLPESLRDIRLGIESIVPVGFSDFKDNPTILDLNSSEFSTYFASKVYEMEIKHPELVKHCKNGLLQKFVEQTGTLGGGNHFIELCLDEEDNVWIMLHSGSRGGGNIIGRTFIEMAKREMERHYIQLPDGDLSFLTEGSDLFDDYCTAVSLAQQFAKISREAMMQRIIGYLQVSKNLPNFILADKIIDCHHNYISVESHYGENVFVTRKGAIRARKNDVGIIPGSMGTKSYIVQGKGNADSFHSCSHGAGRVMSRTAAKKAVSMKEHLDALQGVECSHQESFIDETPAAYKNIEAVIASQTDLIEVLHTLKQVLCIKG